MALLKIIKLSEGVWKHWTDKDGFFGLTRLYAKIPENNKFLIVEAYGAKRRTYAISEIEVYNIGGSAETFANFDDLQIRLKALNYIGYDASFAGSLIDDTANHFKNDYSIVSNTPILSNATGKLGDEVRCTDAGTRDFGSGDVTAGVHDILMHNGTEWFVKVNNNQATDISGKQDTLTDVNFGAFINGLTAKNTPVDADTISYLNSVDGKSVKTTLNNWYNNWLSPKINQQIFNPSFWVTDRFLKIASNNFINTAINAGNFFGGSSPDTGSFKTQLGVGIMSGTNANGGGRYKIEPANVLKPTPNLSYYSCFKLGNTSRDNVVKIGFFNTTDNVTAVTDGMWLQINTASAALNTANGSISSQSPSATLSSTYYEMLLEYVSSTQVNCKIKEVLTGTVAFNQTLTTNIPTTAKTLGCGILATIVTAGTNQTIISLQEMSFGIKPSFLNNF